MTSLHEILPKSAFRAVPLYECESANFAYVNGAFPEGSEQTVYCRPVVEDEVGLRLGEHQCTGYAEFYGGVGLGTNMGGARCALVNNFSYKGVGQTGLSGRGVDFFHSYGGASLFELVLEALWGEVCTLTLPFGGVRTAAIASTGSQVPAKFPKSSGPPTVPRAVAIRQAVVRQAHFMRAVGAEPANWLPPPGFDATRTRDAIICLPQAFQALGMCKASGDQVAVLLDGLDEMHGRAGVQIATARAKRIMHGSLTPSNVAINGSWLDFGSISTVADYGRIVIPRGAPDFMHEEVLYEQSLPDLLFYIRKYYPGVSAGCLSPSAHIAAFRRYFKSALELQFVKLLGFSEAEIAKLPQHVLNRLGASLTTVRDSGNSFSFSILSPDSDYEPVMPPQTGDNHLNSIITIISVADAKEVADSRLQQALPNAKVRSEIVDSCFDAFGHAAKASGNRHIRSELAFHALRLNSSAEDLHRTKLYPRIEYAVTNDAISLQQLIDTESFKASIRLVDKEQFSKQREDGRVFSLRSLDLIATRVQTLTMLGLDELTIEKYLHLCNEDTMISM